MAMNEGIAFEAQLERRQRNPFLRVWGVFRRWPVIPMVVLSIMAIFAVFAPWISPNDPIDQSLRHQYVPPFWNTEERAAWQPSRARPPEEIGLTQYILGTDNLGRDILSRIIYGARISLMVATISLASGILVGSTLGIDWRVVRRDS